LVVFAVELTLESGLAGAGLAAGTEVAAATGKQQAVIPAEKTLSFTTSAAAK